MAHKALHGTPDLFLVTSLNSASSLSIALGVYSVPSAWVTLLTLHLGNLKGFLSLPETSLPLEPSQTGLSVPPPGLQITCPLPHRTWHAAV